MLVLFLGLVGLGMLVVESLRAPAAPPAGAASGDDVLELRLGRVPPEAAAPAPNAAPALPQGTQAAPAAPTPAPGGAAGASAAADSYVVRPGDTLSTIAQQQLGSATLAGELQRLNGITDPDKLRVGQVLRLR